MTIGPKYGNVAETNDLCQVIVFADCSRLNFKWVTIPLQFFVFCLNEFIGVEDYDHYNGGGGDDDDDDNVHSPAVPRL